MNGYERIKKELAGENQGYRPVMMHNFQQCIKERGITFGQFRDDPALAAETFIRNAEKYDLDAVLIDFDTATLAGACGCLAAYPEDKAAVTIQPALTDGFNDMEKLAAVNIESSIHVQNWLETSRIVSDYFGNSKYIRCNCHQAAFSLASMLYGSEQLMEELMDEDVEEDVHRLIELSENVTKQFIRLAAQTGAHCVSNGDSVAGPAMISPEMYRRFAWASEQRIAEEAHRCGVDYGLHICGDATKILEDIKKLDLDIMERDYKTDTVKAASIFGKKITVSGTLDPSDVLLLGSEEKIRQKTIGLLDDFRDTGKLIVCSGCAVSPDTPESHIRTVIDTVRDYR